MELSSLYFVYPLAHFTPPPALVFMNQDMLRNTSPLQNLSLLDPSRGGMGLLDKH